MKLPTLIWLVLAGFELRYFWVKHIVRIGYYLLRQLGYPASPASHLISLLFCPICSLKKSAALISGYAAGEAVRQGCVPICILKKEFTDMRFCMAIPITFVNSPAALR